MDEEDRKLVEALKDIARRADLGENANYLLALLSEKLVEHVEALYQGAVIPDDEGFDEYLPEYPDDDDDIPLTFEGA